MRPDPTYKTIFAHPFMVEELMRWLVADLHGARELVDALDFCAMVLFVTLFRSGFLGLFLIGRGSISHIVPPLSESRCGADWGRRPPW